jgi:prepilin-type N-terminal cleavage/methylation domain-containing protein
VKVRSACGFTLVEILVAMTILTMGFAILFSLSSRSIDGMRRAEDADRRIAFARNKLEELKLLSDLEAGDRATGSLEDGTEWVIEVSPFIVPVIEGLRRNPDAIVHVRLSLKWQGRVEPQTWSVDSYRLIRPRSPGALHSSLESQLNALAR